MDIRPLGPLLLLLLVHFGGCLSTLHPTPHAPERYRAYGDWWLETTPQCDEPRWKHWMANHRPEDLPPAVRGGPPWVAEPETSRALERYATSMVGGGVEGVAYSVELVFAMCGAAPGLRYWLHLQGGRRPPDYNWTRIDQPQWIRGSVGCDEAPWERWGREAGRWPTLEGDSSRGMDARLVDLVKDYYEAAGIRFEDIQARWDELGFGDPDTPYATWKHCVYLVSLVGFDGRIDGWLPYTPWPV